MAKFYEVSEETIQTVYKRNKEELDLDGVSIKKYSELSIVQYEQLKSSKGKYTYIFKNGEILEVPTRGLRLFPRRAILRVGMLLKDSKVSSEIQTQLLNIEEKASDETKTLDIDEEQSLMLSVGMAVASGDATAVAIASAKLIDFKNRHIKQLENDNKALAEGILEWKDRNKLNAGIRKLASVTGIRFSKMWNELYKNLQYKYGICVKQRGGTPYIQWINEFEWNDVMKTFCAMCEAYKQSPTDMLQQITPIRDRKSTRLNSSH